MDVARARKAGAFSSPFRGSFIRSCLKPMVSKIGMELEIVYYEQSEGMLQKAAELVVQTRNASLGEICRDALQEKLQDVGDSHDPESPLKCFSGSSNLEGEEGESVEINLEQYPEEIEFIIEALKNEIRPILYLFRESLLVEKIDLDNSPFARKGSGMVRDFIAHTPTHSQRTTPTNMAASEIEPPVSPDHSTTGTGTNLKHKEQNGTGARHPKLRYKSSSEFQDPEVKSIYLRRMMQAKVDPKDRLLERVASELYHCQENLLPLDFDNTPASATKVIEKVRSKTPDSPLPSSVSSPNLGVKGRNSFEELLIILEAPEKNLPVNSPPPFRPKLGTTIYPESLPTHQKDDGFLTMKRPSKKPLLSHGKQFVEFSRKSECYGYEGPPSPLLFNNFSVPSDSILSEESGVDREEVAGGEGGGIGERKGRERGGRGGGRKWERRTAIRRQRRKVSGSVSEPPPDTSYSYEVNSIQVSADDQTVHKIPCREYHTVGELKEAVVRTLNKYRGQDLREGKWKVSDLVLTYSLDEQEYELYNEFQFIYSTAFYKSWTEEDSTSSPANTVLKVRSAGRMGDKDSKMMSRLSHLTGLTLDDHTPETSHLWRVAEGDKREVQWARRLLHTYVMEEVATRDAESYSLSMELVSRQTSTILALKIPLDNKVEITFHYQQSFSLVKRVNIHLLAVNVLKELYQCVVACGLIDKEKSLISDFVLQVSGERSYIAGRNELLSFKDIRCCIIKDEPIHLSITPRPRPEKDIPIKIHMVPIDAHSSAPPLHTDIVALSHKDCDSQALSIWDVNDELSLQIVQLDQLPVRSLPSKTPVVVEAALYHGATQLCSPCRTSPQPINGLLRVKETVTFKMAKKDVPKSAKVMFTVREPWARKDSTANTRRVSTCKFLYWGLVSITDHQNMLRTGEVQVALWKGNKKDGEEAVEPNPCAPAYNNSNAKAVMLTIKFDCYSFPVYYPCTTRRSWTSMLGMNEGNVALRKQFQRLLDLIKEGKLHSALPTYIEKLDWSNLSKTLEVYSLITELSVAKHFPVATALRMLDCNFPDEHVRKFAVSTLHQVPDEELEDFLLQLTQALKFEIRHDSPLARFLLRRALHNKRIGHFLFWYLKCELHNPVYALRCGVILEAYLKGCGETMLRQFEDQVEIQMKLEEIAVELKQRCSDDQGKMQSLLPELLETHGVPTFTLTPVYNPRIRLGNLRPNKCKIMGSKKKPQWLEMYNVDPSVLRQSPTRLILKLGDDLRQDMITLRMFSLFEKLWEEDSLSDLCLIPYGCMATGPKTGFIEVVNNAKTIAEVSGVSNQSKLLQWIKSHQTNEFRELDPEKVKLAVKKFTHSCAGYSVATYVLGIGDRHNDNIMVTTSGNLFHIDFGHFLGNIKYYMGFKREWAPFVLTPDFVYVMGGEEGAMFETYKNLCCRAFLTLRRKADLIINLFSLMRSTGIPELTCVEDTDYIRNALLLDKTEQEAEQLFRKVIKKCLDLKWTVQVMWKIHLLRRKGS